jgi:hypothetical protein
MIDDWEYGLGDDVEALPEDPRGYGPREIGGPERDKLKAILSAFGFEWVTPRTILDVNVIENGGRRRVTFGGKPVRVVALDVVLQGMPAHEPAEEATPEALQPLAGDGEAIPLELIPEDETPTGEIPALGQPAAPVDEPQPGPPSDQPSSVDSPVSTGPQTPAEPAKPEGD